MTALNAFAPTQHELQDSSTHARSLGGMSPRRMARLVGVLYLLTILGGIFAQAFVSDRLVSFSDAAATANDILSNRSLFQAGFSVYLIEMACQIAAVALLYRLLRPVNGNLALVAVFMEFTGCVIKTLSRLFFIVPLFVLSTPPALAAFNGDELQALALLLLRINDRGAGIALAFFGVGGLVNGYLIFRSTFLPRALGMLAMIGSACWLRYFYPPLRFPPFIFIVLLALASAALQIFWLIVHGVDEGRWRERDRTSR